MSKSTAAKSSAALKITPEQKPQAKKPPIKKAKTLKLNKLEDRIAPGMIGAGLVDPGMADTGSTAPESTVNQQLTEETEVEDVQMRSDQGGEDQQGTYIDESSHESGTTDSETENNNLSDSSERPAEFGSFDQSDAAVGQTDYSVPTDSWREPDWVTANADGSVQIQPPAGVSVEGGIANFPVSVANTELPLPEAVEIQANGSVNVQLPEGTSFNAETGALILPAETVQLSDVPQNLSAFANPDGSITVALPVDGVQFDSSSNTLNLDNHVVNEMTPAHMEINANGSVNITLPEGTEVSANGSLMIPADYVEHMENPPPEYVHEVDWAHAEPDGSITFEPPQGTIVEDGIATFPYDVVNDQLPIPEDVTINADGSIDMGLPEGATYNAELGTLNFPAADFSPNDVPEGIEFWNNPDGSYTVALPDGMEFNAENSTVHMDNHWANEFAPDQVEINTNGSISVALPAGTEYNSDGSFTIPQGHSDFIHTQAPDYVHDVSYSTPVGDGSYVVNPPAGVVLTDGQMQYSPEVVNEHLPIPDDVQFLPDGTMEIEVPVGTVYNADAGSLTFPAGQVHMTEIPEGIQAHMNPDGTLSVILPEGMDYNADAGTVHLDNYWTNEITPPNVEVNTDGSVHVQLPPEVTYQPDGSMLIPADQAGFIETPPTDLAIHGPEWVSANADGSVTFTPPAGIQIDATAGTAVMPVEMMQTQFENYIPDEVNFNPDGTMDVTLPEGTVYSADTGALNFTAGTMNINEIPEQLSPMLNADGSITLVLPDGIDYNTETGAVHLDNYWTNELTPPAVEITPAGMVNVDLPVNTHYGEGFVMVASESAGFIDSPPPEYVTAGPDWVTADMAGHITIEPPAGIQIDATAGTAVMPVEMMQTQFENYIPDEVNFNPDGTMDVKVPEGTLYNATVGSLTFPAGQVHLHEIPDGVPAHVNPDGTVTAVLPPGMSYDVQTGAVHMDNYWTNEMTPPNMEISSEGIMQMQMPETTQYGDGYLTVPTMSADFIETSTPEYVTQGPAWVSADGAGHVTMEPPPGINIDPTSATATMPLDLLQQNFDNYIPDEVTLNPDGTMDVKVPEGTVYNATAGSLTFPEGQMSLAEIPDGVTAQMNLDGTLTAVLPSGMQYDATTGAVHMDNYWTNEMTPPSVEMHTDGTLSVQLPANTHYGEGYLTIPADSAGFIETPAPEYVTQGPAWVSADPAGNVSFTPPPSFTVDPGSGTMSMPMNMVEQHFENYIPDDVTMNADGTMDIKVPEGTVYNAGSSSLTFPVGQVNLAEIPEGVSAQMNPDGTVTAVLPPGMQYDPATGAVHMDNYWTNAMAPPNVEINNTGYVQVQLPDGTQYQPGGSFTVPSEHADFMNDPQPGYVAGGPDWVSTNPDGSFTVEPPPGIMVNPETGMMQMNLDTFRTEFQMPDDMQIYPDGSGDVGVPQGTVYNAGANSLTFPVGTMHPQEMPPGISYNMEPNGAMTVQMPAGMEYNQATSMVHMNNEWLNQVAPEPVQFGMNGMVQVQLPPDTQYFPNGSFVVSAESAHFADPITHQNG